ncbi:MAG: hypothetical protein ACP5I6_03995 [Caldisphaera sp.]
MQNEKEPFLFKSFDKVIGIAHNLNELKNEMERLSNLDPSAVNYHLKEGHIVNWLKYLGEEEIAKKLEGIDNVKEALNVLTYKQESKKQEEIQQTWQQATKGRKRGSKRKKQNMP